MTVEYRDETPFKGDNHTPTELANAIRTKKYGKDVREPIAQLANKLSNAVLGQNIGNVVATPTKTFANLSELQKAYPSGADGVMVTVDNGHKYFWQDNQWKDAGIYQSQGLTSDQNKSIVGALRATAYVYDEESFNNYSNVSNLPQNSIISYSYGNDKLVNSPSTDVGTIITISSRDRNTSDNTRIQFAASRKGDLYSRRLWGNTWTDWRAIKTYGLNELDNNFAIYDSSQITGIYTDANTLKPNTIVTYSVPPVIDNLPDDSIKKSYWCQILTTEKVGGVRLQILVESNGGFYIRYLSGKTSSSWLNLNFEQKIKKIEDKLNEFDTAEISLANFAIFPKFAVIGDSYASGLLGTNSDYNKFVDSGENYQWGRMIARMYGLQYTHLAKSGLSTRTWLTDPSGLQAMQSAEQQDLYMLCLGINDYHGLGESYLGTEADISAKNDTFYGNYGKIINAIKDKAPKAKIIMYGVASDSDIAQKFSKAQKVIADHFGIPYVSLRDDILFKSNFYLSHMEGGHPRIPIYGAMSKAIVRLTEKVISDNVNYFIDMGFES